VAQHRFLAAREDRRHPTTPSRQPAVSDRIDVPGDLVEVAAPHAHRDGAPSEAELCELPSRRDAVLTLGQPRDLVINRDFDIYEMSKSGPKFVVMHR
jgi:hypothetical protein